MSEDHTVVSTENSSYLTGLLEAEGLEGGFGVEGRAFCLDAIFPEIFDNDSRINRPVANNFRSEAQHK
jgi:hypothetical protein